MQSPEAISNTQQFTMVGTVVQRSQITVGLAATAIPMGGVTSVHWAVFINRDPTNNIGLGTTSGVTYANALARLHSGEPCIIPLNDSIAQFYAIANSAPCLMDYILCQF
jgi:hypothetical protein